MSTMFRNMLWSIYGMAILCFILAIWVNTDLDLPVQLSLSGLTLGVGAFIALLAWAADTREGSAR